MSSKKNFIDGKFVGHTYNWKKNQLLSGQILFLHIHKAAGTSIKKSLGLWDGEDSHSTAQWIADSIGIQKFNKLITFTIVRNPWDRVVSAYHYRIQSGRLSKEVSFEKYVNPKTKLGMVHLPKQIDYLSYNGELVCKEILKCESIDSDFSKFVKKYSIVLKEPLKKHRSSKRKTYQSYYTDKTRKQVADWFKEDIEAFNYKF